MSAVSHVSAVRVAEGTAPPLGLKVLVPAPRLDLRPDGPTVSVVVPAMNEARNLPWLARHMPAGVTEIILVDGHSVDDTVEVARSLWPDVVVVSQTRRGKGNALACGFHAATSDIIVMIDADGSMDPGEIPFFVEALVNGADYAKGSRFNAGGGSSDITAVRAVGNKFLNTLTNTLHRTTYTDLCYGYNAFWRRVLPLLSMDPGTPDDDVTERKWGDGFEVETLINIRVHNSGLKIAEVSSFESERLFGSSNLNAVSDGLRVLRTIAIEKRDLRRGDRVRTLAAAVMALSDVSERSKVDAVTATTPGPGEQPAEELAPHHEPQVVQADLRGRVIDLTDRGLNGHRLSDAGSGFAR